MQINEGLRWIDVSSGGAAWELWRHACGHAIGARSMVLGGAGCVDVDEAHAEPEWHGIWLATASMARSGGRSGAVGGYAACTEAAVMGG